MFDVFLSNPNYLEHPITWNVNFPIDLTEETEVRVCSLSDVVYGSCFEKRDMHYSHTVKDVRGERDEGFDTYEILAGNVSITPLDIFSFGKIDEESLKVLGSVWNKKVLG